MISVSQALSAAEPAPQRCAYQTWEWNTIKRRSENHRRIDIAYADITDSERDPLSRCTVCEADQTWINLPGIPKFQMCKQFASKVRTAIQTIIDSGFPIEKISAYRVGRSRGDVDAQGRRTQFSNHSFGTAIDINSDSNGLYGNCVVYGSQCKLRRGGRWNPNKAQSITRGSDVYKTMSGAGFKWGGEIQGRQKDFMHFSLSGY